MKRNLLQRFMVCALSLFIHDYSAKAQNITTLAGGGSLLGDGGQATAAQVMGPYGICVDASGNKYIAQDGTARVRKVTPSGIITTIAGTGSLGSTADGLHATSSNLNYPKDVAVDAAGNIYIAEHGDGAASGNGRIRKMNAATGILTTIAGGGSSLLDGVAATTAAMSPTRIKFDASYSNLYVSDLYTNKVKKVNISTGIITTVAGNGTNAYGAEGVAATATSIAQPDGLAFDAAGNLYLSQQGVYRVSVVKAADGKIYPVAGNGSAGYDGDGIATAHNLYIPFGLATDGNSTLYIAEFGSNLIRKVNLNTGMMTTYAGNTDFGEGGDGGPATNAELSSPIAVATDAEGKLYICNVNGARVRMVGAPACAPPVVNVTGGGAVCPGESRTLTASGSASYTWAPGTGLSSTTGASVTATPAATTTYTVTGGVGTCTTATTVTVSVNATPSAITGSLQICNNLTTTLNSTPSGGTWTSSNGNVSFGAFGVATGVGVGTANVTYTAPIGCTVSATVTVNALPTVTISGPSSICSGSTGTLSSNALSSYSWAPSTGLSCTTCQNTTLLATVPVTYTLTGTDANGCMNTATKSISIDNISLSVSPNKTLCAGSSDTLNATGASSYSWAPSSSLSGATGATVTASPTVTTTYTVTGSIATCTATATVTVSVNPLPGVIGGATQVCQNLTTSFTSTPAGGTWSSSNADATVSSSGVVTGVNAGSATITYMLGTGCYRTKAITVNDLPTVDISGASAMCSGSSTSMTAAMNSTYAWIPSSSLSCNSCQTVTATPTVTTTYTVTSSNASGCIGTATKTITVDNLSMTVSANKTICLGASETLTATGASNYSWLPVTGLSSATDAVVTASPATTTTYSVAGVNGACSQTRTVTVTVNAATGEITGTAQWCKGATTALSCTPTGGTWSTSNTTIATVGSLTGVVTGVNGGTANISYTKAGCSSVKEVTVLATPAITGAPSICVGLSVTMSNALTGGTWSKTVDTFAIIDATTGVLTGVNEGVTTITYTPAIGCAVTKQFTVGLPPAFTTGPWVCLGQTTQVSHPIPGGIWSSSNPARASIDATSGVVHGLSLGNFYVTYTLGTGCSRVAEMAVQTFPMDITGAMSICYGTTTNLSNETPSGTWSSSDTAIASITSSTGTVYGLNAGTTNITYKFQGCYSTEVLTVNALPSDITGLNELCAGSNTTYSSTPAGGTWLSGTANATIDLNTGVATGVAAGTAVFTYSAPITGCRKTRTVAINGQPGVLSGVTTLCAGNTTTITSASEGGTWSSSDATVASVGTALAWSTTVSGLMAGTTTVTATNALGCTRSIEITVAAEAATITGDDVVCLGGTIQLANATTGGTWSSNNTPKATISATGLVTAVAVGTAIITYRTSPTCFTTKSITINGTPAAIIGSSTLCTGATATLAHAEAGGTWMSSHPARASIDATTGQMTGISAGAVTITYNINSGCSRTMAITVYSSPAAISGSSQVCQGSMTTMTNATTGGTWTSSNTAVASVPSSPGNVTGVSAGTATITYRLTSNGCLSTKTITVDALPSTITGLNKLCVGAVSNYVSTPTGGTWTSSNAARASVDASTGDVTAVSAGALTLSYSLSTGCYRTLAMTVNPLPAAIGGTGVVCKNATTSLTNSTTGGTWSSSAVGTASVTSTGVVTGVNAGNAEITYKLTATGCQATRTVTVNELPAAISGANTICAGSTETYSSAPSGGTWVSSVTSKATIGSASGIATGIALGTTLLSYIAPTTGCVVTKQITVNTTPTAVTGTNVVCAGNTVTLTAGNASLVWSSTNIAVATVSSVTTTTATLTGVTPGITTVSYTNGAGCAATLTVTINDALPAITGDRIVCPTRTIQLSNAATGGTWSSALTTRATVTSTGLVTGVNTGAVNISYILSPGCNSVANVTINATPAAITGPTAVCVGDSIDLNHATAGGTWNTASSFASVNSTNGFVTGVSAGTSVVTYSVNSGCWVTASVTVKAAPAPISGSLAVTTGSTASLTNSVSGGIWSSSNTSVASIGSTSGIMTGVAAGSAIITYRLTATQCYVTGNATVTSPGGRSASLENTNNILVYPNPTNGRLSIEATTAGIFTIYTLDGKTLQQYATEAPATSISLPNNLTAGVYMCRFEGSDGNNKTVRIVYTP